MTSERKTLLLEDIARGLRASRDRTGGERDAEIIRELAVAGLQAVEQVRSLLIEADAYISHMLYRGSWPNERYDGERLIGHLRWESGSAASGSSGSVSQNRSRIAGGFMADRGTKKSSFEIRLSLVVFAEEAIHPEIVRDDIAAVLDAAGYRFTIDAEDGND